MIAIRASAMSLGEQLDAKSERDEPEYRRPAVRRSRFFDRQALRCGVNLLGL
jgi:hypothetical protein